MNIEDVLAEMRKKATSLFYGAGVSIDAGGPTDQELSKLIKNRFPKGDATNFLDLVDQVMDFDNFNRGEIEDIVRKRLSVISPNDRHKYLFSLPWRAILTTNYDLLPDNISLSLDEHRIVRTITSPDKDFPIDQTRRDLLYCFKLLGDEKNSFPKGGWMVLSRKDMIYASARRQTFFETFRSLASGGHIVYLGYSFEDDLVIDLLQEMRFVLRSIPWKGFAISPSKPKLVIMEKLTKIGIEWIQGDLQMFIDEAQKMFGLHPESSIDVTNQFFVHGHPITLDQGTVSNCWNVYDVLENNRLTRFSDNPRYFFEGVDKTLYPYSAGWDFKRKIKVVWKNKNNSRTILFNFDDFVKNRVKSGNSSDNMFLCITGGAGAGKSVVANRFVFDWYQSGNPVIFVNRNNFSLDYNVLDGLLDEIRNKYRAHLQEISQEKSKPLRYLLVADDCGNLSGELIKISSHLKAAAKPVDILLVTRKSDIHPNKLQELNVDIIGEIDDTITSDEYIAFEAHFRKLQVLDSEILLGNLRNSEINSSFFSLVYVSIKGAKKTLKEIIEEEFHMLDGDSRKLYSLVCLLRSQMLIPWVSILTKSGNLDIDWLQIEMTKGKLGGILVYENIQRSIIVSNRIIADIITELSFGKIDQLQQALRSLIDAVTITEYQELLFLHMLLIDNIKSGIGKRLNVNQQTELFQKAVTYVKSRPLLLHLSMLQISSGDLDTAGRTLDEAFATHNKEFDEKDQNVIDQMGRLEIRLAEDEIANGSNDKAMEHLIKAEKNFNNAKINPSFTPHPFQGLARTYIRMSKIQNTLESQWSFLLLAMSECVYVEEYCGSQNADMDSIKMQIINSLTENGISEKVIGKMDSIGLGNAYAFLAEAEKSHDNFTDALKLVKKGQIFDPNSLWLLRLEVNLIKITKGESKDIQDVINKYVKIRGKRFDVPLEFELAMDTFKSGDTRMGQNLFNELSYRTRNHQKRLTQVELNRWKENGKDKIFLGTLDKVPKYGNLGIVMCTSRPVNNIRMPVPIKEIQFDPIGGEHITFSIIFNMEGPQASRVRHQ